jgi:hypothetical protein
VFIFTVGFPHKNILQGSQEEALTLSVITLVCFLLPIFANLAISAKLMFFTNRNFINKVVNLSNEIPNVDKNQCSPFEDNCKNSDTNDHVKRELIANVDPIKQQSENFEESSNEVGPCSDGENNSRSDEGDLEEPDIIVASNRDSIENIQISSDVQSISNSPRNENSKNNEIGIAINPFKETNTSFPQVSENIEEHIKFDSEADKKSKAQILAAKRCLLTNLVLGVFFVFSFSSVMINTLDQGVAITALLFSIL